MKPHRPLSFASDEAIEATAAAWLAERDAGLSPDDARSFADWRAADPRHDEAVQRLESAWRSLQALREFRPEARVHPDRDLLARPRASRAIPFPLLVTTAALAACVTLVAAWQWLRPPARTVDEGPHLNYATTVGGYERTTLPDGSVVDLNASSEIHERFSERERRVALVRGEATFTVAKNPSRPFVVTAGGISVRAVGTAFNVRLGTDRVDVLVTEGSVEVAHNSSVAGANTVAVGAGERLTVPEGVQVAARPVVHNVSPAVIREELAWQGLRLVFVETPLAEVIRQFNARNQLQLELGDPDLATLPVGGSFRAEHVEAFVRLLVSDNELVAERAAPDRIVLKRAP